MLYIFVLRYKYPDLSLLAEKAKNRIVSKTVRTGNLTGKFVLFQVVK